MPWVHSSLLRRGGDVQPDDSPATSAMMICDDLRNELAVRAEVDAQAPGAFWFLEVGNSALKNFQDLLLHSSLIAIGPDVDLLDLRWNANVKLPIHAGHDVAQTAQINTVVSVQASLFSFAAQQPFPTLQPWRARWRLMWAQTRHRQASSSTPTQVSGSFHPGIIKNCAHEFRQQRIAALVASIKPALCKTCCRLRATTTTCIQQDACTVDASLRTRPELPESRALLFLLVPFSEYLTSLCHQKAEGEIPDLWLCKLLREAGQTGGAIGARAPPACGLRLAEHHQGSRAAVVRRVLRSS